MAVVESEMYSLAIEGLLTTVISAFYYLRIIKIIYFDELKEPFEEVQVKSITSTVLISCLILITFFLYPSILSDTVNSIFMIK